MLLFSKIHIISITLFTILVHSEKQKNYGQFNLALTKVDTCKGPKKRDCGTYTIKTGSKTDIIFDFQLTENMSPTKGKVVAISNDNEMMRLQINKPCENLFLKPLMQVLYNITNNCIIKKGRYTFVIDFEDVLRKYYGGMHLFGTWAFKSYFHGDHCNLSCTFIEVNIKGEN